MYASKSCAAIYDDFRNSPERAAHDLDTYIFTFTKIGMLSPQFSVQRPAFLKAVFQCESFDVGLIRVRESPEVRVMVLSRLIHLFCTYLTHCAISFHSTVAIYSCLSKMSFYDLGNQCIPLQGINRRSHGKKVKTQLHQAFRSRI